MNKKDENSKKEISYNIKSENYITYKELLLKYRRRAFKNNISKIIIHKLLKK